METGNNTMFNNNISMTRQILQNKSEYIAWKRDLMYDLKIAGYIANTKTTSLKSGKEEEDAVYFVLKAIDFKLKKAIPIDSSATLSNLLQHLESKFASESKIELQKAYRDVKMFGIKPEPFIQRLDEARTRLIHAGGTVLPEAQLNVILANCHQGFYATWIRDQSIALEERTITQVNIEELLNSMRRFYMYSNDSLRKNYEGFQAFNPGKPRTKSFKYES